MSNLQIWDFSKGLNNEFETAMVNEQSVFEPLKFYCIYSILPLCVDMPQRERYFRGNFLAV